MKFALLDKDFSELAHTAVIVGVNTKGEFTSTGQGLNALSKGFLTDMIQKEAFKARVAEVFLLPLCPETEFSHVLLVGVGKRLSLSEGDYRKCVTAANKLLLSTSAKHAAYYLTEIKVPKRNLSWKIKTSVEVCQETLYRFEEYKSKKSKPRTLSLISFALPNAKLKKNAEKALNIGVKIGAGVAYTKNLANHPSNICTPSYLAEAALELSKQHTSLKVSVLDESEMQTLGMNALLSVTKGTSQPAKLIAIEYRGAPETKRPFAFVGKGITFDTGGISLKPADSMVGMKYDMCGAATVLGVLKTAAELQLPCNIVGIIAAVENMPGGSASKPEDIVTTLSGQTVEILNTDAEGRLVLADALTYVERFNPETVIDIATLTGAVVIALGTHLSAVLSNNDALAEELVSAGLRSYDRVWHLPMLPEYQEQLKSPFADMTNVGGRSAGTITAACFLSRFAKKFKWAHLDVAGTAAMMMGGMERYATGRPVPLLMQFLLNRCAHDQS